MTTTRHITAAERILRAFTGREPVSASVLPMARALEAEENRARTLRNQFKTLREACALTTAEVHAYSVTSEPHASTKLRHFGVLRDALHRIGTAAALAQPAEPASAEQPVKRAPKPGDVLTGEAAKAYMLANPGAMVSRTGFIDIYMAHNGKICCFDGGNHFVSAVFGCDDYRSKMYDILPPATPNHAPATPGTPRPGAPLEIAGLPAFWDDSRRALGKDASTCAAELRQALATPSEPAPIPMRLPCPTCGALHLDVGEFAAKRHHTHSCQHCGMTWRPAVVATVGVDFLPGFKNDPAPATPLVTPGPIDQWAEAVKLLGKQVVDRGVQFDNLERGTLRLLTRLDAHEKALRALSDGHFSLDDSDRRRNACEALDSAKGSA